MCYIAKKTKTSTVIDCMSGPYDLIPSNLDCALEGGSYPMKSRFLPFLTGFYACFHWG